MQLTDLQDWFNDNLIELQRVNKRSASIYGHQDCLPQLSATRPTQQHAAKAVTSSCTLQHALAQWPLWNNGGLTTELLEEVQHYKEFDNILGQTKAHTYHSMVQPLTTHERAVG